MSEMDWLVAEAVGLARDDDGDVVDAKTGEWVAGMWCPTEDSIVGRGCALLAAERAGVESLNFNAMFKTWKAVVWGEDARGHRVSAAVEHDTASTAICHAIMLLRAMTGDQRAADRSVEEGLTHGGSQRVEQGGD